MKKNSLRKKIWIYLFAFTLFILSFIWLLQVLFLNKYYEWSKINDIKKIALKLKNSYDKDDYVDIFDNIAFNNDVCIEITKNNTIFYTTDSMSRGCLINNPNLNDYKLKFLNSDNESIIYKIINTKFMNKTLIYGLKINEDTYAFISTSLEPISSTVSVLKTQLVYVTFIVFLVAFIISFIISKKISNPIERITKASKEMSVGNYDVVFDSKTDISEIKDLENTLNQATHELSKTENLRREILANVSHDLKTPLTLIKANAEMVKDLTYNKKEKRNNNLNTILNEVDRLNLLIEDILDLSKMQSNSIKLNYTKFNLNEMIKTIISKFDILCETNGYKISYDGFDYEVRADIKKMEQVIYNLINNAINYTSDKKDVYVSMIDKENCIRIEIKDTGKGISEEDLKYIWDKYYKVDKKYKRVTYGTGLGLSIVKNVLIMHGFRYGVDSKENIGTTFYFEIDK